MNILWLVRRFEELIKIEHGIREAIAFNKKISCRVTIFRSPVMFDREGRGVGIRVLLYVPKDTHTHTYTQPQWRKCRIYVVIV